MATKVAQLMNGETLTSKTTGKSYENIGQLTQGGFARIYEGTDESGTGVIIKQFTASYISERQKWYEREFKALEILNTAPEVKTMELIDKIDYDVGSEKNYALILEYIEGPTLEQFVPQNYPLEVEAACEIMLPICKTLRHMHSNSYVHRDITHRNVILQDGTTPVLIDWGAARLFAQSSGSYTLIGTPGFYPPECSTGSSLSSETDIYSMGVLFNYILTMHARIEASSMPGGALGGAGVNYVVSPKFFNSAIPQVLDDLVRKCTQEDPSARFSKMDELIIAIENAKISYKGVACPKCAEIVPKQDYCSKCGAPILVKIIMTPQLEVPLTGKFVEVPKIGRRIYNREIIMAAGHDILGTVDPEIFTVITRRAEGHFEISENQGNYWIADLGHPNGTILDGMRLPPRKWQLLKEGSRIVIAAGDHQFDLRFSFSKTIQRLDS